MDGPDDPASTTPAHGNEPSAYCSRLADFGAVDPVRKRKANPAPLHTAAELALAVEETRRRTASEVEAAVRMELANDVERQRCALLASLRDQVERHRSAFDAALNRSTDVGVRLALAVAGAVIPKAIERLPLADIRELLKAVLARLVREPSLELRLPEAVADHGKAMITDLAKDIGFGGEIVVLADSSLAVGDVRIRWRSGVIDRSLSQLQQDAAQIAMHWLQEGSEARAEVDPSLPAPPDMLEDRAIRQALNHPRPADE
jgi:flagellar assembly protein FliH